MKRRNFLASLGALAIAPTILRQDDHARHVAVQGRFYAKNPSDEWPAEELPRIIDIRRKELRQLDLRVVERWKQINALEGRKLSVL